MKTWTFPEARPPAGGPWDDEPDKAQWIDPETDLDCLIVRNHNGALCGYVGTPPGHPWYGINFPEIDLPGEGVHGGLSFSDFCADDQEEGWGICHVPEPGRAANVWWVGFDCHHGLHDIAPVFEARMAEMAASNPEFRWPIAPPPPWVQPTYKTFTYVKAEVESLARQVAAAAVTT